MKRIAILLLAFLPFIGNSQILDLSNIIYPNTSTPTINISTTTITLNPNNTGTPSTPGTWSTSGLFLTAGVAIAGPSWIEFSTDGVTYINGVTGITLAQSGGVLISQPVPVFVRTTGAATPASYSGNISLNSAGASQRLIAITGTVNSLTPTIVINPTSLNGFITTQGLASTVKSTTVTGTNLTANISVAPLAGYEFSLDNITFQSTTLTITNSGGNASATLYNRLKAADVAGSYTGNEVLTSSGATPVNLALSGVVNAPGSIDSATFAVTFTSYTQPAGMILVVGDPSTGVRTGTGGLASTIGFTSVATANWKSLTGSSSFDIYGMTGSTMPDFPDNSLMHGWFMYSGSGHGSDSAVLGLGTPQYRFTGLLHSHAYTITIGASLNTATANFTCNNIYYATDGTTVYKGTPAPANASLNTTSEITISVTSSSTGTIDGFLFTVSGQEVCVGNTFKIKG